MVDDDSDENDVCAQGVASATTEGFEAFREDLSPTGKLVADLFAKTHGGGFNDDFVEIANTEARSSAFSFTWHELFNRQSRGKGLRGKCSFATCCLPEMDCGHLDAAHTTK